MMSNKEMAKKSISEARRGTKPDNYGVVMGLISVAYAILSLKKDGEEDGK